MSEFFKGIFRKKEKVEEESQEFNKDVIAIGDEFISSSAMLVDQKISGDFYCLDELIIDAEAAITGNIMANSCVIKGRFTGKVLSPEKIIIQSTAVIEGEITASMAEIERGACINGCITLLRGLQAPELAKKVEESYRDDRRQTLPDFRPSLALRDHIEDRLVKETEAPVINNDPVEMKSTRGNHIPDNKGNENWW